MNRSGKFNFFLPQNTDPIEVSDFNSNFETIDANLLTKAQSLTDAQKAAVRANVDLNVANNLTTAAAGSVLDARQGKVLGDNVGGFREFSYTISANSDAACVSSALADILTKMTEGSFIARVMRSGSWLLECCGAVRNGSAFAECYNTYNGNIYVFSKQSGQDIQTILDLNGMIKKTNSWGHYSSLQLSNCSAYNDIGVIYAKYLGLVVVQIYVTGLTANNRVKIASLPSGYKPIAHVVFVGAGGTSYTSKAYFDINDSGDIYVVSEDPYAQAMIMFWAKNS